MRITRRDFVTKMGRTGSYTAALAAMQSLGGMAITGQAQDQTPTALSSNIGGLQLKLSSTVKPSDTSTSIVIRPAPSKQIVCGQVPLAVHENVVYSRPDAAKGGRSLRMDILVPNAPGKKPLIVFAAGGGFVMDNKESDPTLRAYVAEAGFVVASIEYRTVRDGATYREGVADVKSAIRFLRSAAEQYSIDPDYVGVWGQSAGGYLAAMVGVTNNDKSFETGDRLDQSLHFLRLGFGRRLTFALVQKYRGRSTDYGSAQNAPERRALYVNGFLPDGGLRDRASNPINHIAPSEVAFLLFHGSHDGLVSPSQTLIFHNALLAAGVNSKRYVLEGVNHGDLTVLGDKQAGLPWSSTQTMDLVVDFFRVSLAVRSLG
jgi:acetyl esterase/lipase